MRVVCSCCLEVVATKPPVQGGGVTHGMCQECGEYFGAPWSGMSHDAYLARFAFPVVLVDGDALLVAVDRQACELLRREPREVIGLLGGEALECARTRLPGGCGRTEHRPTCTIRNSVTTTRETGEPVHRVPARLRRAGGALELLISTAWRGTWCASPSSRPPPPAERDRPAGETRSSQRGSPSFPAAAFAGTPRAPLPPARPGPIHASPAVQPAPAAGGTTAGACRRAPPVRASLDTG